MITDVNSPQMAPWMRRAIGRMRFAFWFLSFLFGWVGTGVVSADKKDSPHRPPWLRVDGTYHSAFGFTFSPSEESPSLSLPVDD